MRLRLKNERAKLKMVIIIKWHEYKEWGDRERECVFVRGYCEWERERERDSKSTMMDDKHTFLYSGLFLSQSERVREWESVCHRQSERESESRNRPSDTTQKQRPEKADRKTTHNMDGIFFQINYSRRRTLQLPPEQIIYRFFFLWNGRSRLEDQLIKPWDGNNGNKAIKLKKNKHH